MMRRTELSTIKVCKATCIQSTMITEHFMVTGSSHLTLESFLIQPWIDSNSGLLLDLLPTTSNRCVCHSRISTLLSLASGTDFAEYPYHCTMSHSVSRTRTHHHGDVQWNVASKESLCYWSWQPGFLILSDWHQPLKYGRQIWRWTSGRRAGIWPPVEAHQKEIQDGY
jgi:hypothetical protein